MSVDDDGVPILYGERCVEVAPGQWMDRVGAALAELLAEGLSRSENGDAE